MNAKRTFENPLDRIAFVCTECAHRFESVPDSVEDCPEREYHPYKYNGTCPKCRSAAYQAPWQLGMMASVFGGNSGPKTPEGRASAQNNILKVDQVERSKRYRFNRITHGLCSEVATCFPAKPDKYPECQACGFRDECRAEVAADFALPLKERALFIPCKKRLELFMLHQVAFQTKDPSLLTNLNANLQAKLRSLIDRMIHSILADGVSIKNPQWYKDQETGELQLAEYVNEQGQRQYIYDIIAHPLLKVLTDMVARNNLAMADMGMTPRIQEEERQLQGQLGTEHRRTEETVEFQRRQADTLDNLRRLIENSKRESVIIDQTTDHE